MHLRALLVAVSAQVLGMACGGDVHEAPATQTGTIDQLELRVEAPARAHAGDVIDLRLIVTNREDSTVELSGSLPSDRAQFTVTDRQGSEVWQYVTAIAAIHESWTIAPRAEVSYDGRWKGVDRDGRPVPPGEYTVDGQLITTIPWARSPGTAPVPITILPAE